MEAHGEPALPLNEEPDWLRAGGWQRTDDDHPPADGHPAYRVVYKTTRVVLPNVELAWPNLRVRFSHGTVHRGGMSLPGAVPARGPHRWMLPEKARLVAAGPDLLRYQPDINMQYEFSAWEDEVADAFFVELLLRTDAAADDAQLAEGRSKLASLKVLLELRFGTRLLGLPLAEEVGQLFDDWHFIRSLNSEQLGAESQLPVAAIHPQQVDEWAHTEMETYMGRSRSEKERFGLACDWYWTAIHAGEPVMQFLSLWFAVEVVAMPDTTNVRPVRERLSSIVGGDQANWSEFVGRLYGKRSRLAHGNEPRRVSDDELADLRAMIEALLQAEGGALDPGRADDLRMRAGVS